MAQSEAEKKKKAHEYYMEYRKKGLKKGRKKSKTKAKAKSSKKTSLVGLQTGGLNEQGAMQWALAKEKLTSEMNSALGKAKTQAEKDQIRQQYQQKALSELQKLKKDPSMAKASTSKSSKSSSGSKSSGGSSKSSGGSSKSSGSSSSSAKTSTSSANSADVAQVTKAVEQMKDVVSQLQEKLLDDDVKDKISSMSEEQKQAVRSTIETAIADLRKKMTAVTSIKVR